MHISMDNVYNDNNNVTRSIYQALVITTQGLEWTLNIKEFSFIGENVLKNSQNIILMLGTTPFVTNEFYVNDKLISVALNHTIAFIDLFDFFNEDGMLQIFVHSFNSSLLVLTCFVQILSTCYLKFTFLFSMLWNALRQCLLPSMPPWS
jgi:hypothetical protein